MGFEDAAKRMRAQHGKDVGGNPLLIDPERMIADAVEAEKRSQRVKDLVLGPLLVAGGVVVGVLMYSTLMQAVAETGSLWKTLAMTSLYMKLLLFAPVVAVIVGARKILCGFGLMRR
jgi:hypothetical protein